MSELERRYRRLLRWYPADHRAVHEDEMVAVLLADAGAGQRRPDRRTVLDLVVGGVRLYVRRVVPGPRTPEWRRAFAIARLCLPLAMLAIVGTDLNAVVQTPPGMWSAGMAPGLVRDAGWLIVAERVLAGRPRPWVGFLAWAMVAIQIGMLASADGPLYSSFGLNAWALLLAVMAAASLSVPLGGPQATFPGRHRMLVPASLVGGGIIATVSGVGWSMVGAFVLLEYGVLVAFLVAGIVGLTRGRLARRCTLLLLIPYVGAVLAGLTATRSLWLSGDPPAGLEFLAGNAWMGLEFSIGLMTPLILGFAAVYGVYGLGRLLRVIPAAG